MTALCNYIVEGGVNSRKRKELFEPREMWAHEQMYELAMNQFGLEIRWSPIITAVRFWNSLPIKALGTKL